MLLRLRRFLRMLLLRLAAWLDESSVAAPVPMAGSGPPAHWLEKVRKAQFVSSDAVAPVPASQQDVPRVGVPRQSTPPPHEGGGLKPRPTLIDASAAPRSAALRLRSGPAAAPASSRHGVPAGDLAPIRSTSLQTEAVEPRPSMGPWPELPAGSRRSAGNAAVPAAGRAASSPPALVGEDTYGPAGGDAGAPHDDVDNLWPDLPPDPEVILTLDDADHLRRIDAEQRGAAWSE